jgi:hypothetical protein
VCVCVCVCACVCMRWCVCVFVFLPTPTTSEHLKQSLWNLVWISFYIRPSQWHISYILPISNMNTAAPQIVEVITLILLECLKQSSWNLVYTWDHINGVLHIYLHSVIWTLHPLKLWCFTDFITHTCYKAFFCFLYQILKL